MNVQEKHENVADLSHANLNQAAENLPPLTSEQFGDAMRNLASPSSGTRISNFLSHSCTNAIQDLLGLLPTFAQSVIRLNDCPPDLAQFRDRIAQMQEEFSAAPDSVSQHEPRWHQSGIVTHTRNVVKAAVGGELDLFLEYSELSDLFYKRMGEEIDGRSKLELFLIGVPLHDVGKFARTFTQAATGYDWTDFKPDYSGHEAISGQLIRNSPEIRRALSSYDLTDKQIEFVARTAELHFEFGHLRSAAKKIAQGYSLAFLDSKEMYAGIDEVFRAKSEFALEIAAYFLVDSLGKTSLRVIPGSDGVPLLVTADEALSLKAVPIKVSSVLDGKAFVQAELQRLNEDPDSKLNVSTKLAEAVWQLPTNIWVAVRALELALMSMH